MDSTQKPGPMPVPFALNRQKTAIPQASQVSVTRGAASFNDGFPPLTMTDPLAGGIPPFGTDMNGILFLLSLAIRWVQAGGSFCYDAGFANDPAVGGYPRGAVLLRADLSGFWFNLADNNTTDPDATDGSATGWMSLNPDWNANTGPTQILNRPVIPAAQVNADWDAASGPAEILNKPAIPASYTLPAATTTTLGGIIAGAGTTVAADGTLSAPGLLQTVCSQHPDSKGNCIVQAQNAAVITGQQVSLINQGGATSGSILLKSLASGTGVALTDHSNNIEIDVALSADAGNVLTVGSDHGLFVPATGPVPAADVVNYLRANGQTIIRSVAWGMGSPAITKGPGKVALGASVTVGTEPFTLLTIAAGTYDIEVEQNWQWLSGVTAGNAAGSHINLMKFTLGADLTTVQSITSMKVFQSLYANANTVQQVAQRSVFHDVVIVADPLVQYGMVAYFVNGQTSQSASLSYYATSVNPSDGTVAVSATSGGLTVRFTPKH
ncbi:hypothetical protein P3T23_009410 [Paraburkholderia sp. GAS448]|uniref:hypothetical protein n=1 Tax=Paraburkholderia sp. GAS448 TaxID=3035136 RepID=UPI003D1A786D